LSTLMVRTGKKHLAIGRRNHLRPRRGYKSDTGPMAIAPRRGPHATDDRQKQASTAIAGARIRILGGNHNDSLFGRMGAQGRHFFEQGLHVGGLQRNCVELRLESSIVAAAVSACACLVARS